MEIENIDLLDIKFEIDNILNKSKSIKDTTEKLKEYKEKPIHNTCIDKINNWRLEIVEHKKNIHYFYNKFNLK